MATGSQQTSIESGVFEALTDFKFEQFATPKLIRIFYILGVVLIGLGALAFFVTSLATGEAGAILVAIVVVPIGAFVYLLGLRVYAEVVALLFRMAQSLQDIVDNTGGGGSTLSSQPPSPPTS